MVEVWYAILGIMLTGYAILDGFDLGVGMLHLSLGRTEADRAAMIRSIGPVWDGNEVWLIAAGGSLFCAFPAGYAVAFSGFYLPLIMVLWFLIFRGLAIELRSHLANPLWRQLWDVAFCLSSGALALFLGVALGNVIRGVDLGSDGRFFAPLWTDWKTSGPTGILDWYTLLVGTLAVTALSAHGSTWVALRTASPLATHASRTASRWARATAVLFVAASAATLWVAPHARDRLSAAPWGALLFALPLVAIRMQSRMLAGKRPKAAFGWSCGLIASLLAAAVFGVYPYLLPASEIAAGPGLTAKEAAASEAGLQAAISWWLPAAALVAIYHVVAYRQFRREDCSPTMPPEERPRDD